MQFANSYHDIRTLFKSYFKLNQHDILSSSNLVPNDPTLLFTNSGMVQFKDIFTGIEQTSLKRATTIQKCIRAGGKHNDLENVGFTNRHHTFFEMLGNFSFGDYFKEEAIYFAWKFLTQEIGLPKEKLYITVFHEDEEAFRMWKSLTGFSDDKIIKIKTNDNFWSMGPLGPCGPSSEIFYDYGEKIKGGLPGTKDQDGPRYTEIWNLVFMEFNQVSQNKRIPLEKKGIDTGMGLERLISVIENKTDNYETSLFENLIHYSKEIIGKNSRDNIAYRILADHARSVAFLISEGVHPSSDGRGYVLRRIIRRALKHLYMIGYKGGDFPKITSKVIELMEDDYPELSNARNIILSISKNEEDKFMSTLPTGMRFLENEISQLKKGQSLNAEKAFMLYDTFGFPLDITNDILKSNNIQEVEEKEFEVQMNVQKERSKQSWKGSGDEMQSKDLIAFASNFQETKFKGYTHAKLKAKILGIYKNYIILNETCFYPEGGGQIGDIGFINHIPVIDTFKEKNVILHKLTSTLGLNVNDEVNLSVSLESRQFSANAHSATHLLHHALREKFGESVSQKGSLVERNKLRFDFSFNRPLTQEEIYEIELTINSEIAKNEVVKEQITTLENAKQNGAIAFFGEKYGKEVRTIKINQSFELCGGIHVKNSNEICAFKIMQETAVASGIRRIEAITGSLALNYMLYTGYNMETLRANFKLSKTSLNFENENIIKDEAIAEVLNLQSQLNKQSKEISNLKLELASSKEGLLDGDFYIKCVNNLSPDLARQLAIKNKKKGNVIIVMCIEKDKNTLNIVSNSQNNNAKEIGTKLNKILQGKGGGNASFASFGNIAKKYSEEEILQILKS